MKRIIIIVLCLLGSLGATEKVVKVGINIFPFLATGQVDVVFEGKLSKKLSLGFEHLFVRRPIPTYFETEEYLEETRVTLNIYPQGIFENGIIFSPVATYTTGYMNNYEWYSVSNISALSIGGRILYSFGNSFFKIDPFLCGGWVITHDLLNRIDIPQRGTYDEDGRIVLDDEPYEMNALRNYYYRFGVKVSWIL